MEGQRVAAGRGGARRLGAALVRRGCAMVCGHRWSTLRRELFDCTCELQTKPDGDEIPRFATRKSRFTNLKSRFTPKTLRRGVNSRRRERFFAKNFIGHIVRRHRRPRGLARGRFRRVQGRRRAVVRVGPLGALEPAAEFPGSRARASSAAVGCEVPFDQPSRQQSIAAFIDPDLKQAARFPFAGSWRNSIESSRTPAESISTNSKEIPNSLPA